MSSAFASSCRVMLRFLAISLVMPSPGMCNLAENVSSSLRILIGTAYSGWRNSRVCSRGIWSATLIDSGVTSPHTVCAVPYSGWSRNAMKNSLVFGIIATWPRLMPMLPSIAGKGSGMENREPCRIPSALRPDGSNCMWCILRLQHVQCLRPETSARTNLHQQVNYSQRGRWATWQESLWHAATGGALSIKSRERNQENR
mmetsp:Transcript_5443/g.15142  ORF Transcript_5443/g.15142 Transcript_5443/m.15142 type:complete len:200 (+) Transcript_5443:367-966(+)